MDAKVATEKLNSLQTRIDSLKNKKIALATEIDMLQKQYNERVEELKELGIADPSTLPSTIALLEKEIEDGITNAGNSVSEIENQLNG